MFTTYNFPLSKILSTNSLIQECMNWMLYLPCTGFTLDDLSRVNPNIDFVLSNYQELIISSESEVKNTPTRSLTYHKMSPTYDLTIQIETKMDRTQPWIKFCSFETVKKFPTQFPRFNNSSLSLRLLSQFGGGLDGELPVQIEPTTLKESETGRKIATSIFEQTLNCTLPIIYISASEKDKYAVIPDRLARNLCGMAHIVVEPSRVFSQKLRHEVDSRNIYGGIIGIYWPNGAGATLFRRNSQDVKKFERSIFDEICKISSSGDNKKPEGIHFMQHI